METALWLLAAFGCLVFAAFWLAGFWQYACDEVGAAVGMAMREIGRFFK